MIRIKTQIMVTAACFALMATGAQAAPFGFTVGGGLGYITGASKQNQTFNTPGGAPTQFYSSNPSLSGIIGTLALGYNWELPSCMTIGVDLFGSLSSLQGKRFMGGLNPDTTTTVKMTNSWGLRVRPGVMVTPKTCFHLTVGAASSHWKVNASADTDVATQFQAASVNKSKWGVIYGLGVMSQVVPNLPQMAVGLEFTRTSYNRLPILTQVSALNAADTYTQSNSPSTNVIAVRVVYGF